MEIISHRGYWKSEEEKNSVVAFERSFSMGFGTETDLRDRCGEIVISHDMPTGDEITFEEFLGIYCRYDKSLSLALNIKSDGLQAEVERILKKYSVSTYFLFDMSIPDTVGYIEKGLRVFMRSSEYERESDLWEQASGIWVDSFLGHQFDCGFLERVNSTGKDICIVSPELHKRPHDAEWRLLKDVIEKQRGVVTILCTDIPELAKEYFINGL
ncbi:hypothetical protein A3759_17685 [Thalassolituus sp. HI0120]|nr:hypothetical protein A3759_17685 [Thalassolituus sp. HI0120]